METPTTIAALANQLVEHLDDVDPITEILCDVLTLVDADDDRYVEYGIRFLNQFCTELVNAEVKRLVDEPELAHSFRRDDSDDADKLEQVWLRLNAMI